MVQRARPQRHGTGNEGFMAKQRVDEEQPRTRRRWWRPVLYAAAVVVAALIALPWGMKQVLQNWLLTNGADRSSIAEVDLNLFSGTAALKDVRVEIGSRTVMAARLIGVDFGVWSLLLRGELIVNRGDLDGMRLEIERLPAAGWRIGSIRQGNGKSRGRQTQSWLLRIDQLNVHDSEVMYRGPTVSSNITIASAALTSFTSAPDSPPASLIFNGKIDDAPAELEIQELRLSPRLELAGKITLRELPLGYVAGLFKVRPESVGGTLDASGQLHVVDREQQGMLLTYQGELALAGGKTHGKRLQLEVDQLGWTGTIEYADKTRQAPWALQWEGRLSGRDLTLRFAGESIAATHREIKLNGKIAVSRLKDKFNIKARAALRAAGTILVDTRTGVPLFSMDKIAAAGVESESTELITIKDFAAEGLRVAAGQAGETVVELDRMGFTMARIRDLKTLEAAKITAMGFQVGKTGTPVVLLATDQVEVGGVTTQGLNHVNAAQIDLRGLDVLVNPETGAGPVANLGGAQVTDLAWRDDQGLHIAKVHMQDLQARLRRDTNQQWEIDRLLETGTDPAQRRESPTETRQTETKDRAKAEPRVGGRQTRPRFRVGELRLEGSNEVRLEDQGVRPPFQSSAVVSELRVTGIDTDQPDSAASILLAGNVGRYGKIRLTGTAKPFLAAPELEMKLEARDLELVPLSSYTVPLIGHAMERGQLRIASTVRITGGHMDSQNQLLLAKVKVKAVSPQLAKQLEADIGMRLDRALSLLSDKTGNVKLSVPIVGVLGNTKVGLDDVIGTAIRGALSSGISALGFVLLPQLSFVKGILKGLTKKKTAPIGFEAGRADLQEAHQKALDKLAKQLQQQTTTVQLCPVITFSDVGALLGEPVKNNLLKNKKAELTPQQEDELIALGYDRAVVIKDRLVHQDDIAPDRIFTCAPQATRGADAKPRVELRF